MSFFADNLFQHAQHCLNRRYFYCTDFLFRKRYKQKILLIESDDWGSIRTSSRDALEKLAKLGYDFSSAVYSYDALETEEDMMMLFDVLSQYKDKNGRHPAFVANYCMANPNFFKIRESCFQRYFWESVDETWQQTNGSKGCRKLALDGYAEGYFFPELHGREHIHVSKWMNMLKQKDPCTIQTFDLKMCGLEFRVVQNIEKCYYSGYMNNRETPEMRHILLKDAFREFLSIFGETPMSYVAPNYLWDSVTEGILMEHGIQVVQGIAISKVNDERDEYRYLHVGEKNKLGQKYSVRNCFFEPSSLRVPENVVKECLRQIDVAFQIQVPAIICSHRLNYAGRINPQNRNRNLSMLNVILSEVCKKYPDVAFLSPKEYYEVL